MKELNDISCSESDFFLKFSTCEKRLMRSVIFKAAITVNLRTMFSLKKNRLLLKLNNLKVKLKVMV